MIHSQTMNAAICLIASSLTLLVASVSGQRLLSNEHPLIKAGDASYPAIPSIFQKPWDTEGPQENGAVAIRLAEFSRDAYLDADEARNLFIKRGFTKTQSVQVGSTVAYIVKVNDVVVVAFRGTNSIEDWFINLNFFKKPMDQHGSVHSGFFGAYDKVKQEIINSVKDGSPKYVWITGHSLGGAMALACAYDFIEHQGITVTGVVTFGQPMIGDDQFADYLDNKLKGRHARFVNEKDIVPCVPPFFCHCGSLYWFTNGTVKRNPSRHQVFGANAIQQRGTGGYNELAPLTEAQFEAEKKRVQASRMAKPQLVQGIVEGNSPYIADHSMSLYLQKVNTYLLKPTDGDKPIPSEHSEVLSAIGGRTRIVVKKGSVVELKINDPALAQMVSDLQVTGSDSVKYIGKRYTTDKTPDGKMIVGSGWTCVYVRVDESGEIALDYNKGGQKRHHAISFIARR